MIIFNIFVVVKIVKVFYENKKEFRGMNFCFFISFIIGIGMLNALSSACLIGFNIENIYFYSKVNSDATNVLKSIVYPIFILQGFFYSLIYGAISIKI